MNNQSQARTEHATDDPRARRRAARIADNRSDILDAAEQTFAERGFSEGSLRDIARSAGFSTAAIYNYFENKQQLLAVTLQRRASELLAVIERAAGEATSPMAKLHCIVEATTEWFAAHPHFRRMLRHAREADAVMASVLSQFAGEEINTFPETLALMTSIIEDGQRQGEIRSGSPSALIHLYMTLVYEHVFLAAADTPTGCLTLAEFQDLIDGALRAPR